MVGFTPRSLSVLAERAGFEVRRLWVRHGRNEWRKEREPALRRTFRPGSKGWTAGKFKSLALWPALLVGEFVGRGTTIDVVLVRR